MAPNNPIIKQIPNFLTSMNIFIGCMAISFAFERNLQAAGYLLFLAAIIDFLDGFFARILKAYSDFGKILDSIADVVSFGVAPSIILYQILIMSLTFNDPSFNIETATVSESIILYAAFLVAVFAGIRLARFTVTPSTGNYFQGLPVPATAILIASVALMLVETEKDQLRELILNTYFLIILIFLLCILMVSGLKLMTLKFSTFKISENLSRYILLLISLILLIIFGIFAIPVIFFIYLFISLLQNRNTSLE